MRVKLTFKGKGGNAAFPHNANDALVAASYFITQVQTIVSRNVSIRLKELSSPLVNSMLEQRIM